MSYSTRRSRRTANKNKPKTATTPRGRNKATTNKAAGGSGNQKPARIRNRSARTTDRSSGTAVGAKKTKGGTYNIYKKDSAMAGSFRTAFNAAKKAKKASFTWNGKRYTTRTAQETLGMGDDKPKKKKRVGGFGVKAASSPYPTRATAKKMMKSKKDY